MNDPTENYRRAKVEEINRKVTSDNTAIERLRLEAEYGLFQVWDTHELQEKFTVKGFMAPYAVVEEKETGKVGTVEFQHSPRFYFNFREDK